MELGVKEKGSAVETGTPHQIFQMPLQAPGPYGRAYSVAPDGKRFLVNAQPQAATTEPLTLVVNWTAGLKK